MSPADDEPIRDEELAGLFRGLKGRRLALAVSGGTDSLALMHLVARWARTPDAHAAFSAHRGRDKRLSLSPTAFPGSLPAGMRPPAWLGPDVSRRHLVDEDGWPPVIVLTVDHGLRPEAAAEARFVAGEARALGLPHATLLWEGEKPTTGVQEKARAARYRLMAESIEAEAWTFLAAGDGTFGTNALANPSVSRCLVTAHHREDQVETFLMRMARGSGVDGLAGIMSATATRLPAGQFRRVDRFVSVSRPLLEVPRSRLEATLRALGKRAVEDPSNADTTFERIRLRRALPALAAIGLTPHGLALSARRLARARMGLGSVAHAAARSLMQTHEGILAEIELAKLLQQPGEIRLRILRIALATHSGHEEMPDLAAVEDLQRSLIALRGARRLPPLEAIAKRQTLAGCVVDVEAGRLRIWREAGRMPLPRLALEPGTTTQWDRRFLISSMPDVGPDLEIAALGEAGWRLVAPFVGSALDAYPRPALLVMPAIWNGEDLVAVPFLDLARRDPRSPGGSPLAAAWSAAPWSQPALGPPRFIQRKLTDADVFGFDAQLAQ